MALNIRCIVLGYRINFCAFLINLSSLPFKRFVLLLMPRLLDRVVPRILSGVRLPRDNDSLRLVLLSRSGNREGDVDFIVVSSTSKFKRFGDGI